MWHVSSSSDSVHNRHAGTDRGKLRRAHEGGVDFTFWWHDSQERKTESLLRKFVEKNAF